jgi:hypothetical protein
VDVGPLLERIGAENMDWDPGAVDPWFGTSMLVALWAESGELNADLTRLRLCLGLSGDVQLIDNGQIEGEVTPLVTLGDRPLCAPRGTSGKRCDGIEGCPSTDVSACDSADLAEPLGYFQLNAPPEADRTLDPRRTCNLIRKARGSNASSNLNAVALSNTLSPGNVAALADRLGWEARLGGYSAVTIDEVPVFTTGHWNQSSAPTAWPCGEYSYPDIDPAADGHRLPCNGVSSGADSLFCSSLPSCTDAAQRAQLNHRLLDAVLELKRGSLNRVALPAKVSLHEEHIDSVRRVSGPGGITIDEARVAGSAGAAGVLFAYSGVGAGTVWRDDGSGQYSLAADITGWTDTFGILRINSMDPVHSLYRDLAGLSRSFPGTDRYWSAFVDPFGVGSGTTYLGGMSERLDGILVGAARLELDGLAVGPKPAARTLMDAVELACELLTRNDEAMGCDPTVVPYVDSNNLAEAERYIGCLGERVLRLGATVLFQNIPAAAKNALQRGSGEGSFPTLTGQIGSSVVRLRQHLIAVADTSHAVAQEVGFLADDAEAFRLAVTRARNQGETAARVGELEADIASSVAQATCAGAVASAMMAGTGIDPAAPARLAIGGANAAIQCALSFEQASLQGELAGVQADLDVTNAMLSIEQAIVAFRSATRTRARTLSELRSGLLQSIEAIDGELTEFDRLRRQAQRLFYRAVFLATDTAESKVSDALNARRDGLRSRYERALHNARLMAFVAKRALEQRIGMHLADLRVDLPLVEAPAKWESTVCTLDGIDFDAVVAEGTGASYADGFIGDYVGKLERFIESYRMTYPFHEGDDTAVISIRDDIQRVRGECEVETGNLLRRSGDLAPGPFGAPWVADQCAVDIDGLPLQPCISAATTLDPPPFPSPVPGFGWAPPFDVEFGTDGQHECGDPQDPCGFISRSSVTDMANSSALAQTVQLQAGHYLLSWYELGPKRPLQVVYSDGVTDSVEPAIGNASVDPETGWWRRFSTFEVPRTQDVKIRIAQTTTEAKRTVGALMLEDISLLPVSKLNEGVTAEPPAMLPAPYIGTGDTTTRLLPECEDTFGQRFRSSNWERKCIWLCGDGYSSSCGAAGGQQACYWETTFDLSQWAIERGGILLSSGFARGNFNYRIESLGFNFVGTDVRQCSSSSLPSTCYGGGFVPYSLIHHGPYYVRNHMGADFKASLFTGRIEHARGLATERYLTNPFSQADMGLMDQFLRRELRGRPIDGQYVLRVWEEPGVSFEGIQDVQLILKYRYWTRFN